MPARAPHGLRTRDAFALVDKVVDQAVVRVTVSRSVAPLVAGGHQGRPGHTAQAICKRLIVLSTRDDACDLEASCVLQVAACAGPARPRGNRGTPC
eukprot:scaffold124294_cov60-Phaeocystis_antarctica.AAC.6